jgi:hypothetical protein
MRNDTSLRPLLVKEARDDCNWVISHQTDQPCSACMRRTALKVRRIICEVPLEILAMNAQDLDRAIQTALFDG